MHLNTSALSFISHMKRPRGRAVSAVDHGVAGSNPAGGEILLEPKRRFISQSLSCLPFHRLEMTEILLKGRKTLTHPSIHFSYPSICHAVDMLHFIFGHTYIP